MDLELKGRTALVTGGSQGIGLAITRTLVAEGMRVVAASRSSSSELSDLDAVHFPVDLTEADGPARCVDFTVGELGGLDVLVNNIGGGGTMKGGFEAIDVSDWETTFALNFFATVRVTRAALPSLREEGGGSVVNISSVGGRVPKITYDYCAAKAALNSLTKALAEEYASKGVRFNTITPGVTRTPAFEAAFEDMAASQGPGEDGDSDPLQTLLSQLGISTGRLIEPTEIAAVAAFLASHQADSITGSDLVVDGGMIKTL
ncbi:oxidoreductase [Streptomyces sp. NPDC048057]|uniref:SDR family NAD(P)-dependent oxidoreductase n=1 Tax=Streptomyces sp. NPDC048057 TaxID=3155628 RepID=UPI003402F71B